MKAHRYDSSYLADQVADLHLSANDYFRFLLIESYSEWSDVADQVADLPPIKRQL